MNRLHSIAALVAVALCTSVAPAFATPPTEPVTINSQAEYVAHQLRCVGLLGTPDHTRFCGTMDGTHWPKMGGSNTKCGAQLDPRPKYCPPLEEATAN